MIKTQSDWDQIHDIVVGDLERFKYWSMDTESLNSDGSLAYILLGLGSSRAVVVNLRELQLEAEKKKLDSSLIAVLPPGMVRLLSSPQWYVVGSGLIEDVLKMEELGVYLQVDRLVDTTALLGNLEDRMVFLADNPNNKTGLKQVCYNLWECSHKPERSHAVYVRHFDQMPRAVWNPAIHTYRIYDWPEGNRVPRKVKEGIENYLFLDSICPVALINVLLELDLKTDKLPHLFEPGVTMSDCFAMTLCRARDITTLGYLGYPAHSHLTHNLCSGPVDNVWDVVVGKSGDEEMEPSVQEEEDEGKGHVSSPSHGKF